MLEFVRGEITRIGKTFVWSWEGWKACWASEKSLRQWTLVNFLSVTLVLIVDLAPGERALIVALGLLVLAAERANTAIKVTVDYKTVDHTPTDWHPLACKAKDCGSALVAMTALAGGVASAILLVG